MGSSAGQGGDTSDGPVGQGARGREGVVFLEPKSGLSRPHMHGYLTASNILAALGASKRATRVR